MTFEEKILEKKPIEIIVEGEISINSDGKVVHSGFLINANGASWDEVDAFIYKIASRKLSARQERDG